MNTEHLETVIRSPESYFDKYGDRSPHDYIFQDNGASILAVAHLDIAQPKYLGVYGRHKNIIWSPALDDRLGAWLILHHLPKFAEFDVLLTTNEEMCASTAMFFEPPKQYNWMFQFDRHGFQAVMYQYDTPKLRQKLVKCDITAGHGTYTDIVDLDHLGCAGINFGTCYFDEHSLACRTDLLLVEQQVNKFLKFYKRNQHTRFAHEPLFDRWALDDDDWEWQDFKPKTYDTDGPPHAMLEQCIMCGDFVEAHEFNYNAEMCYICYEGRWNNGRFTTR